MPHLFHFHDIIIFLETASYVGFFVVSLLGSYLIPSPEAVLLMLSGFVASTASLDLNLGWVVFVCALGGFTGDALLFWLSLNGSRHVEYFRKKIKQSKLLKYERYVSTYPGKTLFFLRFVVGVRFFGPVVAGASDVKMKDFLFFNFLISVINACIFVMLGYFLRQKIIVAITAVEVIKNISLLSSALIAGLIIGFFMEKKQLK